MLREELLIFEYLITTIWNLFPKTPATHWLTSSSSSGLFSGLPVFFFFFGWRNCQLIPSYPYHHGHCCYCCCCSAFLHKSPAFEGFIGHWRVWLWRLGSQVKISSIDDEPVMVLGDEHSSKCSVFFGCWQQMSNCNILLQLNWTYWMYSIYRLYLEMLCDSILMYVLHIHTGKPLYLYVRSKGNTILRHVDQFATSQPLNPRRMSVTKISESFLKRCLIK